MQPEPSLRAGSAEQTPSEGDVRGRNALHCPMAPASDDGALDEADLLDRVGGDRVLLREIVGMFLEASPHSLAELRGAIDRGDAATVHRQAHTFKSMVGHFGAAAAVEAALRLEAMGAAGDLAGAQEAWAALQRAVERVRPALARFLDEGGRA